MQIYIEYSAKTCVIWLCIFTSQVSFCFFEPEMTSRIKNNYSLNKLWPWFPLAT